MPERIIPAIRIVSAVAIDENAARKIADHFAAKLLFADYDLQTDTDPELIGGVIVYAGDYRYDHSIRGQLARIASHLKKRQPLDGDLDGETDLDEQMIQETLNDALASFSEEPIIPGNTNLSDDRIGQADEPGFRQRQAEALLILLDAFMYSSTMDEVSLVIRMHDGVATIRGMHNCLSNELVMLGEQTYGIAMNLERENIGVVMLENDNTVHQGTICKRTGAPIRVPAGKSLLGRVVDALGRPIDGMGPVSHSDLRPIEVPAPAILDRKPVTRSLHTGVTAIDALTPIGYGQRELIIGDRQTGKTALAIDAIINQRDKSVQCVYVAIGQKMSTVASVVNTLQRYGALSYTTVVVASASDSAALQYLAPYAGCAMAEGLMERYQSDVLIVYDDLTKHAQAYRAISLLLRRPPGREAYPGDIFYLHARLLERACQLNDERGGGSITALPIVETQSGDISAYIPTNVISITDGQIYLESELFFSGQRPAINVGLSVSRVGGAAQSKAMRKVAGPLRIRLAQYRELEAFSQFGSELDAETQEQLRIGTALLEVLKQNQYHPLPVADQVLMLHLAGQSLMSRLDREDVKRFLERFLQYIHSRYPSMITQISEDGQFTDEHHALLEQAITAFWPRWDAEQEEYGTATV